MKSVLLLVFSLNLLIAGAANAECYADYKAKQDDPLRLHYGVAAVLDDNCKPNEVRTHGEREHTQGGQHAGRERRRFCRGGAPPLPPRGRRPEHEGGGRGQSA